MHDEPGLRKEMNKDVESFELWTFNNIYGDWNKSLNTFITLINREILCG